MNNDAIQKLSSCIYAKDETIKENLVNAIQEVPYLALSSKKDLNEVLTSVFEVNSSNVITKKDIKEFSSKIFEWKKPAKE